MTRSSDRPRSGKAVGAALVAVCLYTMVIRYPTFPHLFGSDSLTIAGLAGAILSSGNVPTGPEAGLFAFLGLAPGSYPAAASILVANFAALSGVDLETAVYIVSTMIAMLSVVSIFVLTYSITRFSTVALMAGVLYSSSTIFALDTTWGLTGRAFLYSIVPFFFLGTIFRKDSTSGVVPPPVLKYASVIIWSIAPFIHRSFPIVLGAAIATKLAIAWFPILSAWADRRFKTMGPALPAVLIVGSASIAVLFGDLQTLRGPNFLRQFFQTNSLLSYALGVALEYAFDIGPAVPLAVLGVVIFVIRFWKRLTLPLLLVVMLLPLLFVVPAGYLSIVLTLPIVIYAASAIQWKRLRSGLLKTQTRAVFVSLVLTGQVLFSATVLLQYREEGRSSGDYSYWIDEDTYQTGIWARYEAQNGTFVSPSIRTAARVAFFSGRPDLIGDISIAQEAHVFGSSLPLETVLGNPRFAPMDQLSYMFEQKTPVYYDDPIRPGVPFIPGSHYNLLLYYPGFRGQIIEGYNIRYYLENVKDSEKYTDYLTPIARFERYVIYGGALEQIRGI